MDAFFAQHGLDQLLVLVVVLAFDGLQVIGPLVGGLSNLPNLDGVSEAFERTVELSLNQRAGSASGWRTVCRTR